MDFAFTASQPGTAGQSGAKCHQANPMQVLSGMWTYPKEGYASTKVQQRQHTSNHNGGQSIHGHGIEDRSAAQQGGAHQGSCHHSRHTRLGACVLGYC